jgi:hypothetical protein
MAAQRLSMYSIVPVQIDYDYLKSLERTSLLIARLKEVRDVRHHLLLSTGTQNHALKKREIIIFSHSSLLFLPKSPLHMPSAAAYCILLPTSERRINHPLITRVSS